MTYRVSTSLENLEKVVNLVKILICLYADIPHYADRHRPIVPRYGAVIISVLLIQYLLVIVLVLLMCISMNDSYMT